MEVKDEFNCIGRDSIELTQQCPTFLYIPNVFSPNNDGINDFFVMYGSFPNVQMIKSFRVYDRWGGLMFEKTDFLPNDPNGWDGKFRGKTVDAGVYTYAAEVLFIDGVVEVYGGDVTVFGVD